MDAGSLENIIKIYNMSNKSHTFMLSNNKSSSNQKDCHIIDEKILAKIAIQILCGLSYLHTNQQLHRDIKPANVLINTKGYVKLTDFGIAK
jgi:serine/threonine protein kinase